MGGGAHEGRSDIPVSDVRSRPGPARSAAAPPCPQRSRARGRCRCRSSHACVLPAAGSLNVARVEEKRKARGGRAGLCGGEWRPGRGPPSCGGGRAAALRAGGRGAAGEGWGGNGTERNMAPPAVRALRARRSAARGPRLLDARCSARGAPLRALDVRVRSSKPALRRAVSTTELGRFASFSPFPSIPNSQKLTAAVLCRALASCHHVTIATNTGAHRRMSLWAVETDIPKYLCAH